MGDALKGREAALEEVQAVREANEKRARTHNRVEVKYEIDGATLSGTEKAKPVAVHAIGGQVFLNSHGEAVLDRDGVIRLRQALDAAFQAVA